MEKLTKVHIITCSYNMDIYILSNKCYTFNDFKEKGDYKL